MKRLAFYCLLLILVGCEESSTLQYPETQKQAVTDTYFGEEVVDNYRWLEDDLSEETADWVGRQNDLTFDFLKKIPFRNQLKER